jgi:hypothetical protein
LIAHYFIKQSTNELTLFSLEELRIFEISLDFGFDNKEEDLLIIFVSKTFFSISSDKS